jgi:hypothetical protein
MHLIAWDEREGADWHAQGVSRVPYALQQAALTT